MTVCKKCDVTWTGLRMAHCCTCGRLFTTVANFDRHRVGPVWKRRCEIDRKTLTEVRPGVWGQPGPESGSDSHRLGGNEDL